MKRRLEKLEKYKNVKDLRILIVEKIAPNTYRSLDLAEEIFTAEELEDLKRSKNLNLFDERMQKKTSEMIEKYLKGD